MKAQLIDVIYIYLLHYACTRMIVYVVTVYWASAHSFLLQVMLLLMMLSLIDMIVWDTGPMSRSGLATIRCGTFPFMLLECYVNQLKLLF